MSLEHKPSQRSHFLSIRASSGEAMVVMSALSWVDCCSFQSPRRHCDVTVTSLREHFFLTEAYWCSWCTYNCFMFWSPSTPTPGFLTSKHLLISAQKIVPQELHKSNHDMTHMTSFTLSPCVCFQKFQSSDSMSTVSAAAPRPNGLGATPQSKEIWTDHAVTLTVNTSWDPMQCLPPRSQSRRVEDHVTSVTVHIHTLSYNSSKVFPHSSKCSMHYESI